MARTVRMSFQGAWKLNVEERNNKECNLENVVENGTYTNPFHYALNV